MTFPSADNDLLMLAPSLSLSPVAPLLSALSEPANISTYNLSVILTAASYVLQRLKWFSIFVCHNNRCTAVVGWQRGLIWACKNTLRHKHLYRCLYPVSVRFKTRLGLFVRRLIPRTRHARSVVRVAPRAASQARHSTSLHFPVPKCMSNFCRVMSFRPISNLPVVSKLIERLVAKRLINYLTTNDMLPKFQSVYR